jgi:hypothetical protein
MGAKIRRSTAQRGRLMQKRDVAVWLAKNSLLLAKNSLLVAGKFPALATLILANPRFSAAFELNRAKIREKFPASRELAAA